MTYDELFNEFCEWNPDLVSLINDYRPWVLIQL